MTTVPSVLILTSVLGPAEEDVTRSVAIRREVTSVIAGPAFRSPLTITLAETSTSAPGTTETAVTRV